MKALTIAEISDPLSPFILQGRSFVRSLALAREFGFEGVELQLRAPEDLDRHFMQECERRNILPVSIATGLACREGLSLSSPDDRIRTASVKRICSQIDLAKAMGCAPAVMIGLMIGHREKDDPTEAYLGRLSDSFLKITEFAEKKGIQINLEPVNHHDSNMLNTWEQVDAFLTAAGCTPVKIGMDLYHMLQEETDPVSTFLNYSDRVGCVQLMDSNRKAPGLGDYDFDALIKAIKTSGYRGPVIMECLPLPDPETALKMSERFFNTYFDENKQEGKR